MSGSVACGAGGVEGSLVFRQKEVDRMAKMLQINQAKVEGCILL